MILKRIRFKDILEEAQNKKETWVQVISCEFYKFSKSTLFTEHPLATDFEMRKA